MTASNFVFLSRISNVFSVLSTSSLQLHFNYLCFPALTVQLSASLQSKALPFAHRSLNLPRYHQCHRGLSHLHLHLPRLGGWRCPVWIFLYLYLHNPCEVNKLHSIILPAPPTGHNTNRPHYYHLARNVQYEINDWVKMKQKNRIQQTKH